MAPHRTYVIAAGLMVGALVVAPVPATAFTLFGITLWGARNADSSGQEIIDPLRYTMAVVVADEAVRSQVESASALWNDRETPASGRGGLLSRARGDYRRILAALYNAGYYGPSISIRLNGMEAADLTLAVELPDLVPVVVEVNPGPRFHFGVAKIVNPPQFEQRRRRWDTPSDPAETGFAPGEPALAAVIGQASRISVERWRALSYAKAREAGREVIADHGTDKLDVTLTLDPDRPARFGPTSVVGESRLRPGFVAYMADLPEGGRFDPERVRAAEDRLNSLGVFRLIRVEEAAEIGADGQLPMTVRIEDGKRRTLGVGATYSTFEGLGLEAFWTHRNLFGRAERLRFDASIQGLGQADDPLDLDYSIGVTLTKPGVLNPDTNFVTGILGEQLDFDTYRETAISARAGLSRSFGRRLTGDVFASVSKARFEDDFGTRHFLTFALSATGTYDRRDNLLEPTRGYLLAAELTPFYEQRYGNPGIRGTVEGRGYLGFGERRRFVTAGRLKLGSYAGPSIEQSPPDQLFFAGGGGSIRGYAYRSIGIDYTEPDGDEVVGGGRGLVETSAEFRARFGERFGGVAFVDAGVVTRDSVPSLDDDLKVGVGLGGRFYTAIGPLRLDVATPINPEPGDSRIGVYIGIGQAF